MKVSRSVFAIALAIAIVPAVFADGGANHQKSSTQYGVSGGNVNDASKAYCCSGTLGSLVTAGGKAYILSNNHVLARADQAVAGEAISQPGLIDNGCRKPPTVANFTTAAPLGSNVDAALAESNGTMDANGSIMDIGYVSSTTASPTVGMSVRKSGRTTGYTTGTIGSINTSVKVQYQKSCNSGRKFTVSYTNQVVINSSTFSAGGDSGSLIVAAGTCPSPVALLFAGSSSTTIGNPINEVLSKLGSRVGGTVSFVSGCSGGGATAKNGVAANLSASEIDRATFVKRQHARGLMLDDAVQGVGVGVADDNSSEAVLVIYVEQGRSHKPIPDQIDGVRTKIVRTDKIRAYGWNESTGQSCHK